MQIGGRGAADRLKTESISDANFAPRYFFSSVGAAVGAAVVVVVLAGGAGGLACAP